MVILPTTEMTIAYASGLTDWDRVQYSDVKTSDQQRSWAEFQIPAKQRRLASCPNPTPIAIASVHQSRHVKLHSIAMGHEL